MVNGLNGQDGQAVAANVGAVILQEPGVAIVQSHNMMVTAAVQIWADRLKQGRVTGLNAPVIYPGVVLEIIKFRLQKIYSLEKPDIRVLSNPFFLI